jgi:hypothetical protein
VTLPVTDGATHRCGASSMALLHVVYERLLSAIHAGAS